MIDVKTALAMRELRTTRMRCGLLARMGSFWIGMHYSKWDRRLCINLLPCVTFWIALPGGTLPR